MEAALNLFGFDISKQAKDYTPCLTLPLDIKVETTLRDPFFQKGHSLERGLARGRESPQL